MRCSLLLVAGLAVGCTSAPPPSTAPATPYVAPALGPSLATVIDDPGGEGFFRAPWPSELRRLPDGRPDLTGFPGHDHFAVAPFFAEAQREIEGFGVSPTIYLRFDRSVASTIVDEAVSEGRIALFAVDDASASSPVALRHRYYPEATTFLPGGTLALRPVLPLEEDRLHALVVLRDQGARGSLSPSPHLAAILAAPTPAHAPVLAKLRAAGVPPEAIAGLTFFRSERATGRLRSLVDGLAQLPAAYRPRLLRAFRRPDLDEAAYRVFEGRFCAPSYQEHPEASPFIQSGGLIRPGDDGRPAPQSVAQTAYASRACGDRMQARFILTAPRDATSPRPLLVYGHGTTGSALSLLGPDGFAALAAEAGMIAVSTDQPLHGSDDPDTARPGSREGFVFRLGPIPIPIPHEGKGAELAFYNVLRPTVMRDNLAQAAIDTAVLGRLLTTPPPGGLGVQLPSVAGPGFFVAGHSQGSQSAVALGAVDPEVRGVLLSACGGDFTASMLERPDAAVPLAIIRRALGAEDGELDGLHPILSLMQMILDPADPATFGRLYREARPARSLLMVQGSHDSMTVAHAAGSLAAAIGAEPLQPIPEPPALLAQLGLAPRAVVQGNAAGGAATFAFAQVAPLPGDEGHFVAFRDAGLRRTMVRYLAALAGPEPPAIRLER
ncbi:MAG: hypothetical protein R3B72_41260 [Polyangiaceae bacterium]